VLNELRDTRPFAPTWPGDASLQAPRGAVFFLPPGRLTAQTPEAGEPLKPGFLPEQRSDQGTGRENGGRYQDKEDPAIKTIHALGEEQAQAEPLINRR